MHSSLRRHSSLCLTDSKFSDCISILLATTSPVKILLISSFTRFKFTNKRLIDFNIAESLLGPDKLLVLLVEVEIYCVVVINGVAPDLLSRIFTFPDLSSINDSVFLVRFNSFEMYSLIFSFLPNIKRYVLMMAIFGIIYRRILVHKNTKVTINFYTPNQIQ